MAPMPPQLDCNSSDEGVPRVVVGGGRDVGHDDDDDGGAGKSSPSRLVVSSSPSSHAHHHHDDDDERQHRRHNGGGGGGGDRHPVPVVHYPSDDEQSGNILDRDYTGMFEGPEKTLEVVFRRVSDEHTDLTMGELSGSAPSSGPIQRVGLRRLSRDDIDRICARARCTILSRVSNQYLDAYVLSESSLFVYPYMLVLKTCGTTTLLRCIATLIDLARKLGLEIDWVGYSRKNFNFPGDQSFPHQSFHQELDYLYGHRNLCERLDGNGYTLGPVTGDHWFVFVADQTKRYMSWDVDTDRVLNIMMFDIDESVAELFAYDHYDRDVPGESKVDETTRISKEQTVASGINALCPGAVIDSRAFEPCGYSMNAILFRSYSTVHITPESESSYASFETNQKVSSYKALINNVVRTFRPKRFVMTLMADEGGLKQVKENPLTDRAGDSKIVVPAAKHHHHNHHPHPASSGTAGTGTEASSAKVAGSSVAGAVPPPSSSYAAIPASPASSGVAAGRSMIYKRSSLASITVEEDCVCMMGNWVLEKTPGSVGTAAAIRAIKTRGLSVS